MSTFDSATLWSATSLASDEAKIGAAGLSVRQRKLLALLSQPTSIADLAQRIALPMEDVRAALDRFAKLGFAQSTAQPKFNPMQTRLRSQTLTPTAAPSPLTLGLAIAALAALGTGAWMLLGGTTAAPSTTSKSNGFEAAPAPAVSPGDTADSVKSTPVFRSAAVATARATPSSSALVLAPVTVAASAATTKPPTAAGPPSAAPSTVQTAKTVAASGDAPAAPAASGAVTVSAPAPSPAPAALPALALSTTLPTVTPAAAVAAPAPAAAPVSAAATTPPPQTVAATSATPTARAAAPREIKLINRVEPLFPRGYDAEKGSVRARLQVDAKGAVTAVEIVEATPPRVFDRAVRSALQQWRYEPTGDAFSVIAEINFVR